ncbi:MAG: hypothetical protein WCE63_00600 [Acidobacteriaceae bacterium]
MESALAGNLGRIGGNFYPDSGDLNFRGVEGTKDDHAYQYLPRQFIKVLIEDYLLQPHRDPDKPLERMTMVIPVKKTALTYLDHRSSVASTAARFPELPISGSTPRGLPHAAIGI